MPKLDEIAESLGLTKPDVFTRQGKRQRGRKPRGPATQAQDESQAESDQPKVLFLNATR